MGQSRKTIAMCLKTLYYSHIETVTPNKSNTKPKGPSDLREVARPEEETASTSKQGFDSEPLK